jgi:aminoglycoside phosphotransferase (APT) family kinase protein
MAPSSSIPPAEVDITPSLIRRLLLDQHPDFAEFEIGDRFQGWDNVTTRLGEALAVRMARLTASAPLAEREIEWLPRIGTGWSFGAPVPIRIGEPGRGYPWRWSVVPWFEGVDATVEPLRGAGAEDIGRALREIHVPAPSDAPHTPWRTAPLFEREGEILTHLGDLDRRARTEVLGWDAARARRLWQEASELPWHRSTWVHADIHVRNVVTRSGRLAAILDWGEAGAGDPAQDLGQLWLLLTSDDADLAFAAYGEVDDETRLRAKGEALATAVRLISTGDAGYIGTGWRGLTNLGLAAGPAPVATL